MSNKEEKIGYLLEDWGYDSEEEIINTYISESVVPGICMNDICDYTTDVEPDCSDSYCEICDTNTVSSILVIAGVI